MEKSSLRELEERLAALCREAETATATAGDTQKEVQSAYARGLGHALNLVQEFCRREKDRTASSEKAQAEPKVYELAPDVAARLNLPALVSKNPAAYSPADLVEAAFRFENMLMAILEDDNTLPWDAYQGLAPAQLAGIIQNSAEEICRIQRG